MTFYSLHERGRTVLVKGSYGDVAHAGVNSDVAHWANPATSDGAYGVVCDFRGTHKQRLVVDKEEAFIGGGDNPPARWLPG